jgi:hypothetical protein
MKALFSQAVAMSPRADAAGATDAHPPSRTASPIETV